MGAAMVNYMDFFVPSYGAAAGGMTALLAWFPWALCRVMAFVILGVLAAEPLVRRLRTGAWRRFAPGTRRLVALAGAWLLLDALLVAAPCRFAPSGGHRRFRGPDPTPLDGRRAPVAGRRRVRAGGQRGAGAAAGPGGEPRFLPPPPGSGCSAWRSCCSRWTPDSRRRWRRCVADTSRGSCRRRSLVGDAGFEPATSTV